MKAIVLAAGYATRLYPLTINKPKALLEVGGQTILDFVVSEIVTIPEIDEIAIVTNARFYETFEEWNKSADYGVKITVINDNTDSDDNKLGAIGDMKYTIDKLKLDDDLLVMASDNIFTFRLKDFYDKYKELDEDIILIKEIESESDLKRMANVVTDENGKVIKMVEKPPVPISKTAAYASYIYKKETLPLINRYLAEGNNPDAPGFFPSWLINHKDLYTYTFTGECYDIGTPEAYAEVCELYK